MDHTNSNATSTRRDPRRRTPRGPVIQPPPALQPAEVPRDPWTGPLRIDPSLSPEEQDEARAETVGVTRDRTPMRNRAPDSDNEYDRIASALEKSRGYLRNSNLSGKRGDRAYWQVGGQGHIATLMAARVRLNTLTGNSKGNGSPSANRTLDREIDLANENRNITLAALAPFRAAQRDAMRANQAVSSGRRPRRSGASVIPNLPGLLGAGTRRI